MAESDRLRPTDRDLISIQQARDLATRARAAQNLLGELDQARIDAIVDHMAAAAAAHAEPLARLAVEETGYGRVADKILKNRFAAERVHRFIRPIRTVGVIARHDDRRVLEIAEPFGVVAAVVPSTNPTSTAIYKALIAVKARCALVFSPHPAAVKCITRTAEVLAEAAAAAGAPPDTLSWMDVVTLEGTQELMRHRHVAVILATGGMGLVRAAYSAGKPAYGVGPGNAPAYIERSADVGKAVGDVMTGKTFDNGLLCSSENAVVVDRAIAETVEREFEKQGGRFLSPSEADALARVLVTAQRLPNPDLVGRPATELAARAGFSVPDGTRVLLARLDGVGRDYPLSIEKLCPALAYYVVEDWREGCERCKEILRYGGMGHTMAIHSQDDEIVLQFGLHKPAFRIVVNTPTTHGSIGLTTGLDPAMTLGCGGFGGNITSDNISPRHLLNIKRLAYELEPASATDATEPAGTGTRSSRFAGGAPVAAGTPGSPPPSGLRADTLAHRIDQFLSSRGVRPRPAAHAAPAATPRPAAPASGTPPAALPSKPPPSGEPPVEFVCEDDVRRALGEGRRIPIDARTIVTPAARDLAGGKDVLHDESAS